MLEHFHHHGILEQRAVKRMSAQLPGVFDADEVARQPDIVEVKLGCLDQPLADVGVKRREPEHDIARLQDREPVACCGVGHTGIRAKGRQVGQLPYAPGAQADKPAEVRKIADLADPAHVALDIGLEVVAKRLPGFELPVVNPGIEAGIQDVVDAARSHPSAGVRQARTAAGEAAPCVRQATGLWRR